MSCTDLSPLSFPLSLRAQSVELGSCWFVWNWPIRRAGHGHWHQRHDTATIQSHGLLNSLSICLSVCLFQSNSAPRIHKLTKKQVWCPSQCIFLIETVIINIFSIKMCLLSLHTDYQSCINLVLCRHHEMLIVWTWLFIVCDRYKWAPLPLVNTSVLSTAVPYLNVFPNFWSDTLYHVWQDLTVLQNS